MKNKIIEFYKKHEGKIILVGAIVSTVAAIGASYYFGKKNGQTEGVEAGVTVVELTMKKAITEKPDMPVKEFLNPEVFKEFLYKELES